MKRTTQINVFYKADGECIHDENIDKYIYHDFEEASETQSIGADTLLRLVKVFVQFSREVQGGNVKRLLFRNPQDYAPKVYRFQPTARAQNVSEKRPIIVHVAHDDIFVVTVTEIVLEDVKSYQMWIIDNNRTSSLSLSEFCESLLDYLRREQQFHLSSMRKDDSNIEQFGEVSNEVNAISSTMEGMESSSPSSSKSIVKVDKERLAEFISNMTRSFLRY